MPSSAADTCEDNCPSGVVSLSPSHLPDESVNVTSSSAPASAKGKRKKRTIQEYAGVTEKASKKKASCPPEDSSSKDRFLKEDVDHIMDWLEDPLHYGAIYGFPGPTPPPGITLMNSTTAYGKLADLVNQSSGGQFRLSSKSMRECWTRHKAKYITTKKVVEATGFGITDADRNKLIFSVVTKKEKLCLGYSRMDALFGCKPNITCNRTGLEEETRGTGTRTCMLG